MGWLVLLGGGLKTEEKEEEFEIFSSRNFVPPPRNMLETLLLDGSLTSFHFPSIPAGLFSRGNSAERGAAA